MFLSRSVAFKVTWVLAACLVAVVIGLVSARSVDAAPLWEPTVSSPFPNGGSASSVSTEALQRVFLDDNDFRREFAAVWGAEAASKVIRVTGEVPAPMTANYATLNTETFNNWAGYRSAVAGIKGVLGTFNVKSNATGQTAAWVGLGMNPILQVGVDDLRMMAWWEWTPNHTATDIPSLDVHANDVINASVGLQTTGEWFVSIYDVTNSHAWGASFSGTLDLKADWMLERVGSNPVGHWGTHNFSNCKWWDSSFAYHAVNYGSGNYYKDTMQYNEGGTTVTVTPSSLTNGTAFSVTRNYGASRSLQRDTERAELHSV
jgi:hypothetical protein